MNCPTLAAYSLANMDTNLDRKGVAALFAKAMEWFIATRPYDATEYLLRSTSGTTDSGPLHVISKTPPGVYEYYDDRRLVVCMGMLNTRLSTTRSARFGRPRNQRILCIDPSDLGANLSQILDDYAPDTVFGAVSFVSALATRARFERMDKVVRVSLTAEYLTTAARDALQKAFPKARVIGSYGTSETSLTTKYPCEFLPPGAHHPFATLDVAIENPDEHGVGDIVLSWDIVPGTRAERYRVGDQGRLVLEPCRCGERRTLVVMGRSGYDYIKLVGAVLRKEEFDRVAALQKEYIDDYRAEAYTVSNHGVTLGGVVLSVYRARGMLNDVERDELGRRVSEVLFVTPTRTYADLVRDKLFAPIVIESVDRAFERTGKEVKLRMRT